MAICATKTYKFLFCDSQVCIKHQNDITKVIREANIHIAQLYININF